MNYKWNYSMKIFIFFILFINVKQEDLFPCINGSLTNDTDSFNKCILIKGEFNSDKRICDFDEENNCLERNMNCSDITEEEQCNIFTPYGDLIRCYYINDTCIELSCITTDPKNCSSYIAVDELKKCILDYENNECKEIYKTIDTEPCHTIYDIDGAPVSCEYLEGESGGLRKYCDFDDLENKMNCLEVFKIPVETEPCRVSIDSFTYEPISCDILPRTNNTLKKRCVFDATFDNCYEEFADTIDSEPCESIKNETTGEPLICQLKSGKYNTEKKKCSFSDNFYHCSELNKTCSDFILENDCNNFIPDDGNNLIRCAYLDGCIETSCSKIDNISNCGYYIPINKKNICYVNSENNGCEETLRIKDSHPCETIYDEDNNPISCNLKKNQTNKDKQVCDFDITPSPNISEIINCMEREMKCSEMTTKKNCITYRPENELIKCEYSKHVKGCIEASCSQIKNISFCGDYIPVNNKKKCAPNFETNECEEVFKIIDSDPCETIYNRNDKPIECKLKANETNNYHKLCDYDNRKTMSKCYEREMKCSEITSEEECLSYTYNNDLTKCIYSDNICRDISCTQITDLSKCGEYIPINPNKTCALNETTKKCEEMDTSSIIVEEEQSGVLKYSVYYFLYVIFILNI